MVNGNGVNMSHMIVSWQERKYIKVFELLSENRE